MLQRLPIAPAQAKDKSQNVLFEVHKKKLSVHCINQKKWRKKCMTIKLNLYIFCKNGYNFH